MYLIKDKIKDGFIYQGRVIFKRFKIEYNLWSRFCHLEFCANEDYTISAALPPVALWFSFGNAHYKEKEISIEFHHNSLWWNFWTSNMGWSSKTPYWRRGSFDFADFLLGRSKYARKVIEERDVEIPMPEKTYSAHVELCEDTWKRPRWFSKTIKRIDAKIPKGIPHQGKGENSWDCGEDGCFGMCCPARSIAIGVGKIVGSVLHDRIRYGGWGDWNYQKRNKNRKEGIAKC
ncbi:hypothetical protein ES703_39963 [subsurface metagenome]